MALDLAILGPDGSPTRVVSIRAKLHEHLMVAANAFGLHLLLRMSDFYADTEFEASELPQLRWEIANILREARHDQEVSSIIEEIEQLVDNAIRENRGISVIAD